MLMKMLNVLGWIIGLAWAAPCLYLSYLCLFVPGETGTVASAGTLAAATFYLYALILTSWGKRSGFMLWTVPLLLLVIQGFVMQAIYPLAVTAGFSVSKALAGAILLEFFLLNSFVILCYLFSSFRKRV